MTSASISRFKFYSFSMTQGSSVTSPSGLSAFERELPPLLADESMLSAPFLFLCYGIQGTLKEVEKEGPIQ